MKKFYAILVAACMSVSLFAQTPSKADLIGYMEAGYYVACFQAPVGSTCKDIYWVGQYGLGWNVNGDLEDYVKCEPLAGFDGWYVAKVPADKGTNGKPIQLNECGKLTWDVQPGPFDGKTVELVDGSVTINDKGAEYDLEDWSVDEPTIITIGSWKNGYNPCELVCKQQVYTIRVYPPYCEYLETVEPSIMGNINNWSEAIPMQFKGTYFELVTEPISDNFEFKFNNGPTNNWAHQFEAYDAENDTWHNIPAADNLSLTNGTEYYEYDAENRILTFDFSDDALYRYAGCEAPEEAEHTVLAVNLPAENAPEAVEIIGTFDDWAGTAMEKLESGWFFVELEAKPSDYFKFRSAGSWDQELEIYSTVNNEWGTIGDGQLTFGQLWVEDTYNGTPCKKIDLGDWSNPELYRWKVKGEEGIENVVLTEKAKKVIVDGVMYIVRDGKMFNVQGAQVR